MKIYDTERVENFLRNTGHKDYRIQDRIELLKKECFKRWINIEDFYLYN